MKRIVETIDLDIDPAIVFRVLSDPWNVESIWPEVIRVDGIERLSHDRWRFRWTRRLLGVRFEGLTELVAFPPHKGILCQITGGTHALMEWVLDKTEQGTHVTLYLDYTPPAPLLHKHSEQSIADAVAADAKAALSNLAAFVTARAPLAH